MHASPSLTPAQAEQLSAALPGFSGTWSLARQESYDGSLVLLVMPESEDLPTFSIDTAEGGIGLAVLRDDVLHACGRFETIAGVIAALRELTEAETSHGPGRRRLI